MSGALVYDDYVSFYNKKIILGLDPFNEQIQPSSVDLSLSNECYEIKTSFLSPKNKVREKLVNTKKFYDPVLNAYQEEPINIDKYLL